MIKTSWLATHTKRHAAEEKREREEGGRRKGRRGRERERDGRDGAQPVVSHEVCHLGKIPACCVCVHVCVNELLVIDHKAFVCLTF